MATDPIDPRITAVFDGLVHNCLRSYGVRVSADARRGEPVIMPDWVFGQPFALVHPDDALTALERLVRHRRAEEAPDDRS